MSVRHSIILLLISISSIFLLAGCKTAPVVGGPVDPTRLTDGIFRGSYKSGPNEAVVEITIRDRRITRVVILKHDAWKGKKAEPIVPERIVEKQSTRVDGVSGATNSSNVIMNAVQDAVEQSYNNSQKK